MVLELSDWAGGMLFGLFLFLFFLVKGGLRKSVVFEELSYRQKVAQKIRDGIET